MPTDNPDDRSRKAQDEENKAVIQDLREKDVSTTDDQVKGGVKRAFQEVDSG